MVGTNPANLSPLGVGNFSKGCAVVLQVLVTVKKIRKRFTCFTSRLILLTHLAGRFFNLAGGKGWKLTAWEPGDFLDACEDWDWIYWIY